MHIKSLGLSRYAAHNGRETLLAFTHTTHWWNSDRHIKKKLTHEKCDIAEELKVKPNRKKN